MKGFLAFLRDRGSVLTSFDRVADGGEKPNIVLLFIDSWAWNGTPIPMNDGIENSSMRVFRCRILSEWLVKE